MDTVGTFGAKTHLTQLLDRVAAGEQIMITRHGTPIARLVPVEPTASQHIRETIARLKEFSRGQRLDGLTIKDLIDRGGVGVGRGDGWRRRGVDAPGPSRSSETVAVLRQRE